MNKRPKAFTLIEMLIVMGIIVLFLAMAIPSIRVLTGSRSISIAQNEVAAILSHARELAVAKDQYAGVLFYLDGSNERVSAVVVQQAILQDPGYQIILLDTVPQQDTIELPPGVWVQTVYNGCLSVSQQQSGQDDRYMGFNNAGQPAATTPPTSPALPGGCILFDGYGRLAQIPYGYQMTAPTNGGPNASGLCTTFRLTWGHLGIGSNGALGNLGNNSIEFVPGAVTQGVTSVLPAQLVTSQMGLVLFDADSFKQQGFNIFDADFSSSQSYTGNWPVTSTSDGLHSEQQEETWLDNNSTPVMVNRYNGTLIKGE